MLEMPQCLRCAHYRFGSGVIGGSCLAFPDGIPRAIYRNRIRHDVPYPGDRGIVFTARETHTESDMGPEAFVDEVIGDDPALRKLLDIDP